MSTEEAAWKAELGARVADLFRVKDNALPEWTRMVRTADALGSLISGLVKPHIQAAEERGRREGLRQAALVVRLDAGDWDGWPEKQAAMKYAANLIDRAVVDPESP